MTSLSQRMRSVLRASRPQSLSTGDCWANTGAGFVGEAASLASALPTLRRASICSNMEKFRGHGPEENDIISPKCTSNLVRRSGWSSETSLRVGLSSSLSPYYSFCAFQSKSLLEQVGHASWVRWRSAFSRNNHGNTRRNDHRNNKTSSLVMNDLQSVEEAAEKAFGVLNDLDPRSLAAFWSRVSRLMDPRHQRTEPARQSRRSDPRQLMRQLGAIYLKTIRELEGFRPRDLAQTAHGFAKIATVPRYSRGSPQEILREILIGERAQNHTFQSIANASVRVLSKFEARYLCNLAYANAIVDSVPILEDGTTLFDHIAEKSIPLLGNFDPQGLSNLVWSFEKVGAPHAKLFANLADGIIEVDHLGKFKPQELSNITLAYAKSGESNQRLFEKIADHIVSHRNLRDFNPQECSNLSWAFAKAGMSHMRLFAKVADHITSHDSLHSFSAQALANTVWAFEKAGVSHPRLFERVADHILELDHLGKFKPQALSNIIMAYTKSGESNQRLFKKIADHIIALDSLKNFKPQEYSNISWAFAKAGVSHSRLFAKVADHIVALDNLHKFEAQSLSNTVWAFAKAGLPHPRLFEKVADRIIALDDLSSFGAPNCAQILSAYASANIIIVPLFEKVAKYTNENIVFENLDKRTQKSLLSAFIAAEKAEKSLTEKQEISPPSGHSHD